MAQIQSFLSDLAAGTPWTFQILINRYPIPGFVLNFFSQIQILINPNVLIGIVFEIFKIIFYIQILHFLHSSPPHCPYLFFSKNCWSRAIIWSFEGMNRCLSIPTHEPKRGDSFFIHLERKKFEKLYEFRRGQEFLAKNSFLTIPENIFFISSAIIICSKNLLNHQKLEFAPSGNWTGNHSCWDANVHFHWAITAFCARVII